MTPYLIRRTGEVVDRASGEVLGRVEHDPERARWSYSAGRYGWRYPSRQPAARALYDAWKRAGGER